MEKDYIYVYDKKGKKQKMELVFTLKLKDYKESYIVYKETNKKVPLYMAKTEIVEGITTLDTDLNEKEQKILTKVIKQKLLEGNNEIYQY